MGIYVFGDEFTGRSEPVLNTLDRLNKEDEDGDRFVRINAVGFPNVIGEGFQPIGFEVRKFDAGADLRARGAFVGLERKPGFSKSSDSGTLSDADPKASFPPTLDYIRAARPSIYGP